MDKPGVEPATVVTTMACRRERTGFQGRGGEGLSGALCEECFTGPFVDLCSRLIGIGMISGSRK